MIVNFHFFTRKLLTYIFDITDASLWKETFEKAKKIVGTECEIYTGKNNPDAEADSDSDSSYNETDESDVEDKTTENPEKDSPKESNEKEATNTNNTDSSTDQVTEQLTNLDVKDTKEE